MTHRVVMRVRVSFKMSHKKYQDEGGLEKQSKDNTPLVVCDRAQVLRNLFMTPQGSGCVRQTGADHGRFLPHYLVIGFSLGQPPTFVTFQVPLFKKR